MSGFRDLDLRDSYDPPDRPLQSFYVPVLSAAKTYDRMAGFFRSSALAVAAAGLARFIEGGGKMRLIVGAQLDAGDAKAITDGSELADVVAERLSKNPLEATSAIVERRLEVLAWLVREGRLEIKVGLPTDATGKPLPPHLATGYFHTKSAVLTDSDGQQVAFKGSTNESESAWVHNHEQIDVFRSWEEPFWNRYGAPIVKRFEAHWNGSPDQGWAVLDLPEAARQNLIQYAPASNRKPPVKDPLEEQGDSQSPARIAAQIEYVRRAPSIDGGTGVGIATAAATPYPHQEAITRRAVDVYPRGFLLADEVGLGKTIEAGMILRELLLTGKAETALLLVPASVLRQWQQELHERIAIEVPRYENRRFFDYADNEIQAPVGSSPWNAFPVLLASSHLARRTNERDKVVAAGPWDIVLVDEAHHARRRSKKAGDRNALLRLLREMRNSHSWKALYLASATPMQMNAYEAWDLLALFGLEGQWGENSENFVRYYSQLRKDFDERDWPFLSQMLIDFFHDPGARRDEALEAAIKSEYGSAGTWTLRNSGESGFTSSAAQALADNGLKDPTDQWLKAHTPMRDRVFRTTRSTLRRYKAEGLIPADINIPNRQVFDAFIEMTPQEQALYGRIETYISKFYDLSKKAAGSKVNALGFIMTVYRRRLTSSFEAVEKSLRRRLEGLEQKGGQVLLDDDDRAALEGTLFSEEVDESLLAGAALEDEINEVKSFLKELEKRPAIESKMQRLINDLDSTFAGQHETVVIFTQYTDTMDYIREMMKSKYGASMGCYSGRGGELWDPDTGSWTKVPKEIIKQMFRDGEVRVLVGTDSMSEGLNLQTSGRLINYDMPWNFMRVEQRIGRIDRIGGRPQVEITNYFYEDTVEEQIYRGIAEDVDWFEDVVGPAQPVLRRVEEAIEDIAMKAPSEQRSAALAERIEQIRMEIEEAGHRPVTLDDMENVASIEGHPEPAIDLELLEEVLAGTAIDAQLLSPHPSIQGAFLMEAGTFQLEPVTFRRQVFDEHPSTVSLLTYLTPQFEALVDTLAGDAASATEGDEVEVPTSRSELESLLGLTPD